VFVCARTWAENISRRLAGDSKRPTTKPQRRSFRVLTYHGVGYFDLQALKMMIPQYHDVLLISLPERTHIGFDYWFIRTSVMARNIAN